MPLLDYLLTILIGWWFLSLFFRRITSPMRPVSRWGKKWSSRGWHGFWRTAWDVLYRKAAQKRGPAFGLWWLGCVCYGFYGLHVLQTGQGYDRLFLIGLALFKFILERSKKPTHRSLPSRHQRRFRRDMVSPGEAHYRRFSLSEPEVLSQA